ncbi:MAG: phosphoribosyl-ATP pyrophosphohydrolase [Candidatus Saccharimonadales bacterium]
MKVYNKLVRDKIPEIIEADGKKPVTRYLNKDEYLQALIDKLTEECEEFKVDNNVEELADIQEVVLALADALDITPGELAKAVSMKTLERGAFKKHIFLESVE